MTYTGNENPHNTHMYSSPIKKVPRFTDLTRSKKTRRKKIRRQRDSKCTNPWKSGP